MNEQFTGGRWEYCKEERTIYAQEHDEHVDFVVVFEIGYMSDVEYEKELHANGHLMAAAGDMYRELQSMCSNALELGYCNEDDCEYCQTRAVFRKARGEKK